MLSKEEIEQARSILLRGNDIESASLILRAMILEGWVESGGRVNILKVATVEILDFIEENKNKGNLDYIKEKVRANNKVKQLEVDKQNLIEKLEEYIDKTKKEKIPSFNTVTDMIKYKGYAEGRLKACNEILELVKGETHE